MEEADGQGYSRVHTITRPQVSKKETVVSYVNSYHLMQNGEQKNGYVILNFGLDQMVKLEDSEDSLLAGGVLYDGRGNVLLSSGNLTIGYEEAKEYAANANTTLSNGNILIHSENLEDSWMLVAEISSDGLRHEILPMILLLIVIYAVILAVLSVILVYFIRGYTRPIEQLYQAAVSVSEGSLETKVNIRTNDELELLGNAFNQMLDSINSYIVQMEQHEKEKKEMELEQLLLQINPHFIYNTLNTIVYMAQIKGHDDIIQYTNAFIGLLQDTLKIEKEGSLVGLDAEIATIQKYLMLMSYRYPNRFQTIYSIDESVEMCRVPSVMLQPIVENAIFHGLAISKKPGVLEISAKRQDEDVVIEVKDNGCGMSEETLRKIWTDEGNNRDTMRKIGISNVRKRLKAMYGENCSFTIESEEGKGTRVRIRIPYQ